MAGPISAFSATKTASTQWAATGATIAGNFSTPGNSSKYSKALTYVTGTSTVGQANQFIPILQSIGSGGNTTVNIAAATVNILGNAAATLARIKGIRVQVLSTSDDSVNGTNCTSVTLGAAASNPFYSNPAGSGWLGSNTSTFDIPNGGYVDFGVNNANGVPVNNTNCNIKILNNDGGNAAAVQIELLGADA